MPRHALVVCCILVALPAQSPQTVGTWTAVATALVPPPRSEAQLVYDPARDVMFLAGGIPPGQANPLSEFWEFDGTNWAQRVPAHPIDLAARPTRFVFCPARGRVLALSSEVAFSTAPMVLSEWNGSDFVSIPSNAPSCRGTYFDIAWDDSRAVLVLFGGGTAYADTWEWNGTTWQQRGTGGPPGRYDHRMCYDAARRRVVLVGGISYQGGVQYSDTWEWDGAVWREQFGVPSPGVYRRFGLAYDAVLQQSIVFGGRLVGSNATGRTSRYDGSGWSTLTTFGGPAAMEGAAIAYDSLRNRILSFGGYTGPASQPGTLSLAIRTGVVASFGAHGAGCPGPAGVASLTARSGSRPVLGSTFRLRFDSLANTPLALVFACIGYDDQSWNGQPLPQDLGALGMPGCQLRIAPAATQVLANVGGVADWDIPLPASPALDGARFFVQGAVLAPAFNPGGVVLSASGTGTAGAL